jgi:thioredoxin reductase (NADPH)
MKEIAASDFENEVLKGGKIVVDFYSSECPPCEALAPKFEALSELYGEKIKFLKIFRQQNRELATQLGVSSSPTLLFFDNGQQLPISMSGGIKKTAIKKQLNSMIFEHEVTEIEAKQKPNFLEYDVAILGGGPAGLTAGIYLGQANIKTVLIDPALPGGYMGITHQVSNYPGFTDAQPGYMLAHNMSEQAKKSGIDFKVAVDITSVDLHKKEIVIDEHETIRAKKIIIATGTTPKSMFAKGEKELKGKGISYCATCDAKYFVDKEVIVIGSGNSAVEEALFITKFAKKVRIVYRSEKLKANEKALDLLAKNKKIELVASLEPRAFLKHNDKMIVQFENLKTSELVSLDSDGVFAFIGFEANTNELGNKLPAMTQWGNIITDQNMKTDIPDIYAIGDIIDKKHRQITTAVADGTIAAISISTELN